jgi:hypothetical protein
MLVAGGLVAVASIRQIAPADEAAT